MLGKGLVRVMGRSDDGQVNLNLSLTLLDVKLVIVCQS